MHQGINRKSFTNTIDEFLCLTILKIRDPAAPYMLANIIKKGNVNNKPFRKRKMNLTNMMIPFKKINIFGKTYQKLGNTNGLSQNQAISMQSENEDD